MGPVSGSEGVVDVNARRARRAACANSGSFLVSPGLNRTFSRSRMSPSSSASRVLLGIGADGLPMKTQQVDREARTAFRPRASSSSPGWVFPWGVPGGKRVPPVRPPRWRTGSWEWRPGFGCRLGLVTASRGTLKSTRMKRRRPDRSNWLTDSFFMVHQNDQYILCPPPSQRRLGAYLDSIGVQPMVPFGRFEGGEHE